MSRRCPYLKEYYRETIGPLRSYHFDCHLKSGKMERVPLDDIMREALPEIVDQFEKHGVPVQIPPNLPE